MPYELLATQYLEALEAGLHPGVVLRQRYGIDEKGWQRRRTWMSAQGWLPKGDPNNGPRLPGEVWIAAARQQLKDRIRRDAAYYRDAAQRRGHAEQTRRLKLEHAVARQRVTRQPRPRTSRSRQQSVVEVFL